MLGRNNNIYRHDSIVLKVLINPIEESIPTMTRLKFPSSAGYNLDNGADYLGSHFGDEADNTCSDEDHIDPGIRLWRS